MRNPNNLLSKNTFSIQKNLKETHVIESAIQISTAKKFQHTFNIQKIQNLHTDINIHSTSKNTLNIQISTAIQNLQYIQHTKKFLQYKSTPTKISAALKISAIQISTYIQHPKIHSTYKFLLQYIQHTKKFLQYKFLLQIKYAALKNFYYIK